MLIQKESKHFRSLGIVLYLDIIHSLDADMAVSTTVCKIVSDKEDILKGIAMLRSIFQYRIVLIILLRCKIEL